MLVTWPVKREQQSNLPSFMPVPAYNLGHESKETRRNWKNSASLHSM